MQSFALLIAVLSADPDAELVEPKDGGTYRIVNLATGKALDVIDSSKLSPAALVQAEPDPASHSQLWKFEKSNVGHKLINMNSGHAVDVPNSRRKPGIGLIQYQLHGGRNQQWVLAKSPRPPGWAIQSLQSKLAISAHAKANGVAQMPWLKRAEQLWRFEPVANKQGGSDR